MAPQPHPNRLQNTHVLIFGGTSGIGYAVASLCLSNGAHVTISGSRQAKVDVKVALLKETYPSAPADTVRGYACNLADTPNVEANITAVFDQATENGAKKIDHVVFTAGDMPPMPPLTDLTIEATAGVFPIRWTATLFIAKLLASKDNSYVTRSTSSSLTLTGGTNTTKPFPGWTLGAGMGGSVEGMTRGLAVDLAPLRVNMVEPGAIRSELLEVYVQGEEGQKREAWMKEGTLVGALGEVQDVAEAYGWLLRDRFVTGTVARCDGGRLLVGNAPYSAE